MSVIGACVMLLLALVVVLLYVVNQKKVLTQQRYLSDLKEKQQKELLAATLAAQETERQRIAANLHDDIGILLTTSQLFIQQLPDAPETTEHRQTSLDLIDSALEQVRAISRGLGADNLTKFGVVVALKDVIELLAKDDRCPSISLQADPLQGLLSDQELALFRICKELLANGVKHAAAKNISIQLRQTGRRFTLRYQDDGVGMALSDKQLTSTVGPGLGLKSIQARTILLNGELALQTAPGAGFELSLQFTI